MLTRFALVGLFLTVVVWVPTKLAPPGPEGPVSTQRLVLGGLLFVLCSALIWLLDWFDRREQG